MTVSLVAAAAGVTEPTVYLRHPTKHDLAVAAIARLPMLTHPPDTGDTKADLTALLHQFVEIGHTIGLAAIGVVLVEESEHPELLDRWRHTVGAAGLRAVEQIVQRGSAAGRDFERGCRRRSSPICSWAPISLATPHKGQQPRLDRGNHQRRLARPHRPLTGKEAPTGLAP